MSYFRGPDVITDGLVLYLDAGNIKSFPGEPTVNLSYNNGQTNSEYLAASYHWINSGTWTLNLNDTSIDKPQDLISTPGRILSGEVTGTGNIMNGCGRTVISPSTEYTMSVYFRQNRAGSNQPYLRTNVNNNSLGNFIYNGSSNAATWPVDTWIRISITVTTQANENAIYLSNYIGHAIGDKVYYCGHQIEQKNHMTNVAFGTRGTTVATGGGWKDLSKNNTNAALSSGITYDTSNVGSIVLNQTTGYLSFGHNTLLEPPNITIISWIKLIDIGDRHILITKWLGWSFEISATGYPYFRVNGSNVYDIMSSVPISWNEWYQIASTFDDTNNTRTIAINGIVNNSITDTGSISYNQSSFNIPYAGNPVYGKGQISTLQIYDRALSATEILQNYNATKSRFGL